MLRTPGYFNLRVRTCHGKRMARQCCSTPCHQGRSLNCTCFFLTFASNSNSFLFGKLWFANHRSPFLVYYQGWERNKIRSSIFYTENEPCQFPALTRWYVQQTVNQTNTVNKRGVCPLHLTPKILCFWVPYISDQSFPYVLFASSFRVHLHTFLGEFSPT